jgi:hypothetical protein
MHMLLSALMLSAQLILVQERPADLATKSQRRVQAAERDGRFSLSPRNIPSLVC